MVLLSLPLFIRNSLHNRAKALRPRYLPYMIALCVGLILFFSGIITGEINSTLNLVSGKAMIFPLALLSPVVGSYCISQAIRKKASVLLLLILATFLTTSFAPLYYWHIPSPEGLADSYVLLKKTSTTFRVPLFTDDFSQSRAPDWNTITGVWSVSGGALISSGNGTEQILILNKNWTDHIVSARVKWGLGSVGLVFRAQDANNSYIFNVDHSNNEASVLRILNGTSKRLESVAISSIGTKWLELRVEVNGTEIQCNIDNAFLFSVEDDTFQEGVIGLQTSDANASFDKVEISVRSFDEQKWFRVLSLPHYPRMLAAQILYGDFSSPDGWFDQGGDTILHMSNSTAVSLVFQHAGVYVFELDEAYPVTASSSAFVIDDGDEISTFKEIIVNETFSPPRGVFLSKNSDLGKVSWQRWDWQANHNGDSNLTVNSVQITSTRMEFGLTVNRSSFISIPISYLPGLRTEVDGQEVEMLKALPAFVAIQVPAGTHTISVSRQATTLENVSTIISAVTLVSLLSVPTVGFVKGRVRKRVASVNSDSNLQQVQ